MVVVRRMQLKTQSIFVAQVLFAHPSSQIDKVVDQRLREIGGVLHCMRQLINHHTVFFLFILSFTPFAWPWPRVSLFQLGLAFLSFWSGLLGNFRKTRLADVFSTFPRA